jgi:trans-aconitate methyltransferase
MKPQVAKQLIEAGVERTHVKQSWADLGAGNGVFTHALSTLLHDGSTVYAVDKNSAPMDSIRVWQQVVLKRIQADFVRDAWDTEPLNGILMANALHFVKDKEPFLKQLKARLAPDGRLIIVEYEMEKGNHWVPYPVGFSTLTKLVKHAGFATIQKLKEIPSVYDNRMMYSVVMA